MNATLDQAIHLLTALRDKLCEIDPGNVHRRLKDLFDSGIIFDIMEIKCPMSIDRDKFRHQLGLQPLPLRGAFTVKTNFNHYVNELLHTILWRFQYDYDDYPTIPRSYRGKGKALCVPVGWKTIHGATVKWLEKKFVLAGFLETLVVANETQKPGAYICPIPVSMPEAGPGVSGITLKHWVILRDREGAMFLLLEEFTTEMLTSDRDSFYLPVGKGVVEIKKRDVFIVLLYPQ